MQARSAVSQKENTARRKAVAHVLSDMLSRQVTMKVDGKEMRSTEDLTEVLKGFRPGDTVSMEILRTYDNSILKVDVLLLDAKAAEG